MERIKDLSKGIRVISQVIFWATIAFTTLIILFLVLPGGIVRTLSSISPKLEFFDQKIPLTQLDFFAKFIAGMMVVLSVFPFLLGLHHFIRLFRLYEQRKIFTGENIARIRTLGWILILYFPLSVSVEVLKCLLAVYLKMRVTLLVNSFQKNFGYLIVGVGVILISHVMNEAKKLQDEQELIL